MSTSTRRSRFFHPASALLILGLDWLLFSGSVLTLGFSTGTLALIGLGLGGVGTVWVQRRFADDGSVASLMKGALGGVAVGIPLPVAGTAVGGGILALSGLDRLRNRPDREALSAPDASSNRPD